MEDLLAEIDRKRKSIEDNEITANKKYFKRGDVLEAQKEELIRERAKLAKEKISKESETSKQPKVNSNYDEKAVKETMIPRDEVILRLRAKGLPIRLFGESDADACHRLKLAEIMEQEENKGLTNDFQEALDKTDHAVLLDHYNSEKKNLPIECSFTDDTATLLSIKEAAKNLNKTVDVGKDCDTILSFLKLMLSIWSRNLDKRSLDEKGTLAGKMEGARYEQTYSYIKPLFKKLRTRTLAIDILKHLKLIVFHCLERNYVKANDAYLQMAIGNAPWPIGVTMVGIHARTGRERIASEHVAHVLNDETQRKFIQALKRLMTYCQRTFTTDPSRSVEYGALDGRIHPL